MTEYHKAIPTLFNGVTYRSKSEARLAVCFHDWGWNYEYEPVIRSMPRFKPDFLIRHKNEKLRVIEYKPCLPTEKCLSKLSSNFKQLLRNNFNQKDDIRCELWCVDFYEQKSIRIRYSLTNQEVLDFSTLCKSFSPGCEFRFDLTNESPAKVDLSKIIPE